MPQFGRDNHTKGDFEPQRTRRGILNHKGTKNTKGDLPQRHKGHEGGLTTKAQRSRRVRYLCLSGLWGDDFTTKKLYADSVDG